MIALVVHELAEAGCLNIEAPVSTYLPEFNDTRVGAEVALWHLLSHTGGFESVDVADPAVLRDYSWEKFVASHQRVPFLFEPGAVFSYSTSGFALLREIANRNLTKPVTQFVRERFFDPLHLKVGEKHNTDDGAVLNIETQVHDGHAGKLIRAPKAVVSDFWSASPTSFVMSPADLISLQTAINRARDANVGEGGIVARNAALTLQRQVVRVPYVSGGPRSERLPATMGLGIAEFAPNWLGSSGAFFGQSFALRFHGTANISIAVGLNVHAPVVCEVIFDELIRSLTGDAPPPVSEVDKQFLPAQELVGEYVGASTSTGARVSSKGDDLVCEFDADRLGQRKLGVLMKMDQYRRWIVRSDPGSSALGFFRDPVTGNPCLMIGATAYRKC